MISMIIDTIKYPFTIIRKNKDFLLLKPSAPSTFFNKYYSINDLFYSDTLK